MRRYTVSEIANDIKDLPLEEFLFKYYNPNVSLSDNFSWQYSWNKWMEEYVLPAYDLNRRDEFCRNFGVKNREGFGFAEMERIKSQLEKEIILESDIRMFLGFMAGTGFFKERDVSIWLDSKNWQGNKQINPKFQKSFLEIAKINNGQNYLRANLLLNDWWKR